jgi:ribose 1,5-bisphosphokinase
MSGVAAKRSLDPGSVGSGAATPFATLESSPPPQSGALILVVGPSASGKDTLLDAARRHFRAEGRLVFSRRVITRTDQTGEPHEIVSEHTFRRIAEDGGFFLAWEAHGLHYGISTGVLDALKRGRSVVINVSRQIIPDARGKWPNTHVISVMASEEVRRRRLLARGRESAQDIDERLRRAMTCDLPGGDWVTSVDNSGDLVSGVARFVGAISAVLEQGEVRSHDFVAARP